jgi:hypothetical protein
MLRDDPVSEPRPRRATILPPHRRQEIPALHVGPEAIPDEVHDVPAVRRRVGADAYRSQGIADALRNAAEREQAGRRLTIRAAMVRALTMGAVDPVRVFEIVDRVMADEIKAGRL